MNIKKTRKMTKYMTMTVIIKNRETGETKYMSRRKLGKYLQYLKEIIEFINFPIKYSR